MRPEKEENPKNEENPKSEENPKNEGNLKNEENPNNEDIPKNDENPEHKDARGSRNLWPVIFGMLLTAYAVFTLLDAFVIPGDVVSPEELARSGTVVGDGLPDEGSGNEALRDDIEEKNTEETEEKDTLKKDTGEERIPVDDALAKSPLDLDISLNETSEDDSDKVSEPVVTETSYTSDGISITITTLERYDTQIYVADVILSDASYLKTGLAGGSFGRNISDTTSDIAEENDAILAINGDYYGFRKRGFVMRNGYLYRDIAQNDSGQEDLVIYEDGSLEIVAEAKTDASALAEAGAVQIFSFGPGLIEDGEIAVDEGSEVEQAMRSNPRTAIGEIEPLHYIFLVSDGRTKESAGLTLFELAEVMRELGCETAYNLDGGGSSTMWFMGEVVNHPTNGHRSGERSVSDIVYISE